MTPHGLRYVLDLRRAPTKLQGIVAVLLVGPHIEHLTIIDLEHSYRHMLSVVGKDPGHADLLRYYARPHRPNPTA